MPVTVWETPVQEEQIKTIAYQSMHIWRETEVLDRNVVFLNKAKTRIIISNNRWIFLHMSREYAISL